MAEDKKFTEGQWVRKCDECGHKQTDTKPVDGEDISNDYEYRKCKKCGSEALDYGSEHSENPDSNNWY